MAKSATVELKVLAEATDAIKDIRKVEGSLDDLEAAAKGVGQGATGIDDLAESIEGLQETTRAAAKAGGGLSEAFAGGLAGGAVVAGVDALKGIVTEGFSRLAGLASDAFTGALNFNTGRIRLQAQLGLNAEDAKKFGQLAGDLYSEAYGGSLDEVNEALGLVTRTAHLSIDAQRSDLKQLTGDVLNLADVFGVDLQKVVVAAGQLQKTGLAKNFAEATDLLTRGLQVAGQDADDLLDTFVEYPTNFRRLGLSGAQALGLINQGLKAGARNSDQVADSLKEFSLRIVDGSKKTSDALKTIGLDAVAIPRDIARGGDSAREAFGKVVDAIKRIEDPAQRLIAITDLFGTPAEDMAAAWDSLDLSHAVQELGTVEGAAKQLGDTIAGDPTQKWEAFKRSIETNVIQFLADTVIPKIEELTPKLQEALTKFSVAWEGFKTGFTGAAPPTGSITALENLSPDQSTFQEFQNFGEEVRALADEWLPRLPGAAAGGRLRCLCGHHLHHQGSPEATERKPGSYSVRLRPIGRGLVHCVGRDGPCSEVG
jgi:phage-related minor tail protein